MCVSVELGRLLVQVVVRVVGVVVGSVVGVVRVIVGGGVVDNGVVGLVFDVDGAVGDGRVVGVVVWVVGDGSVFYDCCCCFGAIHLVI